MFHVYAGKYEQVDGAYEENCKYCDSFETIEEAKEAYNSVRSYPWASIEDEQGNKLGLEI